PRHDGLGRATRVVRKAFFPGTDEDADNRIVLEQGQVHGERGDLPAGESDRQQPAVPTHEPGQRVEERPADIVDADVEAFVAGEGFPALTRVVARMADALRGPMLAYNRGLRGCAYPRDDARAEQMRALDASQPNPAGGARHEDGFTGLEPC